MATSHNVSKRQVKRLETSRFHTIVAITEKIRDSWLQFLKDSSEGPELGIQTYGGLSIMGVVGTIRCTVATGKRSAVEDRELRGIRLCQLDLRQPPQHRSNGSNTLYFLKNAPLFQNLIPLTAVAALLRFGGSSSRHRVGFRLEVTAVRRIVPSQIPLFACHVEPVHLDDVPVPEQLRHDGPDHPLPFVFIRPRSQSRNACHEVRLQVRTGSFEFAEFPQDFPRLLGLAHPSVGPAF